MILILKNKQKIELVLGIAVQCPTKEVYIEAILTLNDEIQGRLLIIIEELLSRFKNIEETETFSNLEFEKEKKLLRKLDEIEFENTKLNTQLKESNDERDVLKNKFNALKLQFEDKCKEFRRITIKSQSFLDQVFYLK